MFANKQDLAHVRAAHRPAAAHTLHRASLHGRPGLAWLCAASQRPYTRQSALLSLPHAGWARTQSMTAPELTEALQLHTVRSHDWQIMPCCALTGEGINEGQARSSTRPALACVPVLTM